MTCARCGRTCTGRDVVWGTLDGRCGRCRPAPAGDRVSWTLAALFVTLYIAFLFVANLLRQPTG